MNIIKAIGEYAEMVKNGLKNGDKIIEGLYTAAQVKNGTISEDALAEILRRKEICADCIFNSKNAQRQRGYASALPFQHCTLCKCRIGYEDSKEFCLDCNCGIEAWNQRNPDKPQMPLKWKAFNNSNEQKQ